MNNSDGKEIEPSMPNYSIVNSFYKNTRQMNTNQPDIYDLQITKQPAFTEISLIYSYTTILQVEHKSYVEMRIALIKQFIGQAVISICRFNKLACINLRFENYKPTHLAELSDVLRNTKIVRSVSDPFKYHDYSSCLLLKLSQPKRITNAPHSLELQPSNLELQAGNTKSTEYLVVETARFAYMHLYMWDTVELALKLASSTLQYKYYDNFAILTIKSKTNTELQKIIKNLILLAYKIVYIKSINNNIEILNKNMKIVNRQDTNQEWQSNILVPPKIGEFIRGKRDGKLRKIETKTECEIKIEIKEIAGNEIMEIRIKGRTTRLISGLEMILGELPIEESCWINGKYHKSIIGKKGKTIQEIIKKYDVYVRFIRQEEMETRNTRQNVELQAQFKNVKNIEKIKKELYEMIGKEYKEKMNEVHCAVLTGIFK